MDDADKKAKPSETPKEKPKEESPPPPADERGTSIKDGWGKIIRK